MEQSDFDLLDFLPYLLNQAAEESSLAFKEVYQSRYGLLRIEWRVIFHLGRYGAMTATEIGRRSKTHKTKISRAVNRLEERRYLTRTRSESDRRQESLSLTPAGRRVFSDLVGQAQAYNEKLLKAFSEREREILVRCLAELAKLPET